MWEWLRGRLGSGRGLRASNVVLPIIEPGQMRSFCAVSHGLPQVDWGMVDHWVSKREASEGERALLRRAVASAWLDEVRGALEVAHRRWKGERVEGLGPVEDDLAPRVARAAERAIGVIGPALRPIRGDGAIDDLAIVAFQETEDYYSFIAHEYPEEGEFATSGGVYMHQREVDFPVIAMPLRVRHGVESTIAHELTHHALWALDLPLWVEEGLTQMMEERVTGASNFVFTHEMVERHRAHWGRRGLERFWSGRSFHSPEDDEQELSYNLSQAIVRRQLSDRAKAFFAFARACRSSDDGADAAGKHLDCGLDELAEQVLGRAGPSLRLTR